jgi:hypothetical protein
MFSAPLISLRRFCAVTDIGAERWLSETSQQEIKKQDAMKLKTKIRAGKIRPNHNVTIHGTSLFLRQRQDCGADPETAEVVIPPTSPSGR